tara:strand:+ start:55 stop:462 length:408 start_codon:yes stop_codon:yes gene_type:complete
MALVRGKDTFDLKCPCCGFNFSKPKNISARIMKMVSAYSKKCSSDLKMVMRDIYDNVPSDKSPEAYYYFLYGIQNIEEEHVRYGIRVFKKGNHHMSAKGFQFLRAIIRNRQSNFNKQFNNERKLHGKPPKKRELK